MEIEGIVIDTDNDVYTPAEDSICLAESIAVDSPVNTPVDRLLEIGTGTGFISIYLSKLAKEIIAVDINPKSVELAAKNIKENHINNIHVIKSDMFEKIRGKFDIIIFNPPYLPVNEDGLLAKAWSGGEGGIEPLIRFLDGAKQYLNPNGKIYIIISSLCTTDKLHKEITKKGYMFEIKHRSKIPWEELIVYKITPK